MKKLVVIDGKSVFYRGYHAMRNLSLRDGTPIGGVYGFAVIAMELVRRLEPDKVVVAWDKAKTSIAKRKEMYAGYKAGRKKPDEDFFVQIPYLRELIGELGWAFLECDGYEADDIIGTLAAQASEKGEYKTFIISSDLDMLQVVNENVTMWRLIRGFSELEEVDVAAIEKKYGILKKQFLDLKALKGDVSDNIVGVMGIGEKGAVKLLQKYVNIEEIYEHLDEIVGAMQKKLLAGRESAFLSKKLATIMTDAPVKLEDVADFKLDKARVREVLEKLEFRSLVKKFELNEEGESAGGKINEENKDKERKLPEDLIVEWDVKAKMHIDAKVAEAIKQGTKFYDLGQGMFLLNPLERKMDEIIKEEEKDCIKNLNSVDKKNKEYWRQQGEFEKREKLKKIFYGLDMKLIPVLYRMEKHGMKISRGYFRELAEELNTKITQLEKEIWQIAGIEFNIASPMQLSEILFEKLKLPTAGIKKNKKFYSTGAKELEKLKSQHEIIEKIKEYREETKLLNTYVMPLPELADEDDRIHTTFTQNITATGRLSSVAPNLQNIPVRTEEGKKIRTGFVAGNGKRLISADYSQFELRLVAVLAGDKSLIEDFNAGIDIHKKTAADVYGVEVNAVTKKQRRSAKVINFGVLYGMSAQGLAAATGMTMSEARGFIERYFEVRKPIRLYLDKILRQAREKGYAETLYGRRRPTPDVLASNFMVRSTAERAAMNMPIQGTEADLMKKAMIAVDRRLRGELLGRADLVCQVHDSLIVECDEDKETQEKVMTILREEMEGVEPGLKIKLQVDITTGKNWGEL